MTKQICAGGNERFQLMVIVEPPNDKIIGYEIWSEGIRLAGPFTIAAEARAILQQYIEADEDSFEDEPKPEAPRVG